MLNSKVIFNQGNELPQLDARQRFFPTKDPTFTGINHLTLAMRELLRSITFYQDSLGFRLAARWRTREYLELVSLWLCLIVDHEILSAPALYYTHYALTVAQEHFHAFVLKLRSQGIAQWKENQIEGDSFYFLDSNGHQLEAHASSLAVRIAQCRM